MDSTSLLHINYLSFNPYIIKSVVTSSIKIILHFQKGLEEIKQICIERKKFWTVKYTCIVWGCSCVQMSCMTFSFMKKNFKPFQAFFNKQNRCTTNV